MTVQTHLVVLFWTAGKGGEWTDKCLPSTWLILTSTVQYTGGRGGFGGGGDKGVFTSRPSSPSLTPPPPRPHHHHPTAHITSLSCRVRISGCEINLRRLLLVFFRRALRISLWFSSSKECDFAYSIKMLPCS